MHNTSNTCTTLLTNLRKCCSGDELELSFYLSLYLGLNESTHDCSRSQYQLRLSGIGTCRPPSRKMHWLLACPTYSACSWPATGCPTQCGQSHFIVPTALCLSILVGYDIC